MISQLYPTSPSQHTNSPTPGELPLSSPSVSGSGSDKHASMTARRTRSSRACDQCRRNKNKCEPASGPIAACRSCLSMGIACTYTNPSRKRGPPKGYILALERRLQQVEALLGTIIGSQDPRARSLVEDLSHDGLAYHIMRRVDRGPFSPTHQPLGTTKQDFLESMIMSDQESYDGAGGQLFMDPNTNALAYSSPSAAASDDTFAVPDFDWHQRIQDMLDVSQASRMRRQSLQSTTSNASSSHRPTSHSIPSPTSHSNPNHPSTFSGPMTPVDALSPMTPASLTMAPSSSSSPIHTPGSSPYPYPYMNLPSTQQSQPPATQYVSQAQYAVPPSSHSRPSARSPYGNPNPSQNTGEQQQQHTQTSADWFQDFSGVSGGVRLNQFGDTSELQDVKPPGLGLGSTQSNGNGGGMPMVRVYDSSGYDVSNARMQAGGRYPCPA